MIFRFTEHVVHTKRRGEKSNETTQALHNGSTDRNGENTSRGREPIIIIVAVVVEFVDTPPESRVVVPRARPRRRRELYAASETRRV